MKTQYNYPFTEGDTVCHISDQSLIGVVTKIDRNLPHPTTCNVRWNDNSDNLPMDDLSDDDIQWTNKLVLL